MDNTVHFGDGIIDEAKAEFNNRTKGLIKIAIDLIFDCFERKVKNFPDKIPEIVQQLRNNPEIEQEIFVLWSEHLFEEGLVTKGYTGLPDNLLISNFHQEGYSDGLYVGYVLAMMALVDKNIPEDIILFVRDYIRTNLIGQRYDARDKIIEQYKEEKYRWIDETRETKR
ncbi:MAG: hypothetical protein WBH77_08325 [Saccharofermentanales bacterium]